MRRPDFAVFVPTIGGTPFDEECSFEVIVGGCRLYPVGVDPIVRPADIEYDIDLSVEKGGIDLRPLARVEIHLRTGPVGYIADDIDASPPAFAFEKIYPWRICSVVAGNDKIGFLLTGEYDYP